MELLECINLNKSYGNKQVLKDINLKIPRGKIIGLLGKNGTGKSTLIKLINDLLTIDSGSVLINGKEVGVESKKIISYLPERTYLDKTMTVIEVINYFSEFYDDFDSKKAIKLLKDLDLDINQKLSKMSKGMQEKVQLVLVMSRSASLYILDEPLGGVDPATRDYILDTILTNFKEGASVIISTHLIQDVERILDEVIFIDKGRIILQSDSDELRKKEKGSIDDCSIDVIFPYFGKDLIQPPTSFAKGGRFNAEGESYLYLSSNIETCISELRLDVGEKCSVGKFCCKRVFKYVDFTSNKMSFLFNVVKQLLLAPVHSDNKSYYLLTQSIAKVFKVLNFHGICYPSTQVNSEKNYNVVCFYPKDFYFVNYSDEIYTVEAINYSYSKLNESYKEYCDYDMLLNLENEIESKRKEKLFDYIRQK